MDTQKFIEKAKEIHKDKYDYSQVEYKNVRTKIKIICKIHGEFLQHSRFHLKGQNCYKCGRENGIKSRTFTQEEFIKKANKIHNYRYNYSLVNYKNSRTKIKIICPIHQIYEQRPDNHLFRFGCTKCGSKKGTDNNKLTTQEFIEKAIKIHKDKYNYSLVEYKRSKEKIKIICKIHGEFIQVPNDHLNGKGCPQCPTIISKPHQKIINFLLSLDLKEQEDFIVNDKKKIKPMELDIYLPVFKLAIEIDGMYWHGKLESCKQDKDYIKDRDEKKNKLCKEKNIKLLRFTDLEINKNFEKVKGSITNYVT